MNHCRIAVNIHRNGGRQVVLIHTIASLHKSISTKYNYDKSLRKTGVKLDFLTTITLRPRIYSSIVPIPIYFISRDKVAELRSPLLAIFEADVP